MNTDILNKWLTLVANIGVVAGIVFLAIELQQNTDMMRAQTRQAISESSNIINTVISNDMEIAQVIAKGIRGDLEQSLTAEWGVFQAFVKIQLTNPENELYQYEQGLFEEDEFRARQQVLRRTMTNPSYRLVWEGSKETYSNGFRESLDRILIEAESDGT